MGLKEQLALDIVQFALDLGGIADPTGALDAVSGLISLGRGRWLDAAISGISMVPYIGDLAKTAKLPRYVKSVREAIKLAAKDAEFAAILKPALGKLKAALDKVPFDQLPASARGYIQELRAEIDVFLRRSDALLLGKAGFGRIEFIGLMNTRLLREVTQQEVRNAFAKVGLREAHNSHFISRLILRGPDFGIHSLRDFAAALNNGVKRIGAEPGTVEILSANGRFSIVVNAANELITFLPIR